MHFDVWIFAILVLEFLLATVMDIYILAFPRKCNFDAIFIVATCLIYGIYFDSLILCPNVM